MQDYLRTKTAIKLRGNPIKHHNSQQQRPEVKRGRKKSDLNRCLHALLNKNGAHFFSESSQS